MADFTITVPDAFLAGHDVVPAVTARAEHIENLAVTQKILTAWGEPDVASLTTVEKGELVLLVHIWTLTKRWERWAAEIAAGNAADQDALDDFSP